jgi:hypothetical protein
LHHDRHLLISLIAAYPHGSTLLLSPSVQNYLCVDVHKAEKADLFRETGEVPGGVAAVE